MVRYLDAPEENQVEGVYLAIIKVREREREKKKESLLSEKHLKRLIILFIQICIHHRIIFLSYNPERTFKLSSLWIYLYICLYLSDLEYILRFLLISNS